MWRAGGLALAIYALVCTSASAEGLNGRWTGWYFCAQGLTGLTLTITGDDERARVHDVAAHFSFYSLPDNPHVPSGAFAMDGFHTNDNRLMLRGRDWIERPVNYETVDLAGHIDHDADGEVLRGAVGFAAAPDLCTTFELRREGAPIS
jgi:hypothetical protein